MASLDLPKTWEPSAPPPQWGCARRSSGERSRVVRPLGSWGGSARSLYPTWLHVLVTHQEGCAPHGSRRANTASARPRAPPPEPSGLRPAPARPPPAPRRRRPRPRRPLQPAAPAGRHPGGVGVVWLSLSKAARAAAKTGSGRRRPDSTVSSAFFPITQPFPPPGPVIFLFPPLTRPNRCWCFLPQRPARRAPCRPLGSAPGCARRSTPQPASPPRTAGEFFQGGSGQSRT